MESATKNNSLRNKYIIVDYYKTPLIWSNTALDPIDMVTTNSTVDTWKFLFKPWVDHIVFWSRDCLQLCFKVTLNNNAATYYYGCLIEADIPIKGSFVIPLYAKQKQIFMSYKWQDTYPTREYEENEKILLDGAVILADTAHIGNIKFTDWAEANGFDLT